MDCRAIRCFNGDCPAGASDIVVHVSDGFRVCTVCGTVQPDQLIQELEPFLWGAVAASFEDEQLRHGSKGGCLWTGSDYRPEFHWNEDDKLRCMCGPGVPEYNKLLIFDQIMSYGYKPSTYLPNAKHVIQSACRAIDKKFKVDLYGRKFGENWISLVCEFSGGKQRPPIPDENERQFMKNKFFNIIYAWPYCSYLLNGSVKGRRRKQLPQYRWLYRMLQMTFFPERFTELWLEWLPIMSHKKEKELKTFWKKVCFILGWPYVRLSSFVDISPKNRYRRKIKKPATA